MENYAPIFRIISIVCFSAAGAALLLAVFLFIKFRIISVIGDLTGKTARKSIQKMREENEKSGVKSHRPTPLAAQRGPITKPIESYNLGVDSEDTTPITQQSVYGYGAASSGKGYDPNATAPMTNVQQGNSVANSPQNTDIDNNLYQPVNQQVNAAFQQSKQFTEKSDMPVSDETTPLNRPQAQETSVLNGETQLLNNKDIQQKLNTKKVELHLNQNIILIHTEEYI